MSHTAREAASHVSKPGVAALHVDDLTAGLLPVSQDWLRRELGAHTLVRRVTPVAGGYSGSRLWRLELEAEAGPSSLILKVTRHAELRMDLVHGDAGLWRREADAYRWLSDCGVCMPYCQAASIDNSQRQTALLLEDMARPSACMPECGPRWSDTRIEATVALFARLHVAGYRVVAETGGAWLRQAEGALVAADDLGLAIAVLIDSSQTERWARPLSPWLEAVAAVWPERVALLRAQPQTVCHADFYPPNAFFHHDARGETTLTLIDWQMVRCDAAQTDLLEAMTMAACMGADLDAFLARYRRLVSEGAAGLPPALQRAVCISLTADTFDLAWRAAADVMDASTVVLLARRLRLFGALGPWGLKQLRDVAARRDPPGGLGAPVGAPAPTCRVPAPREERSHNGEGWSCRQQWSPRVC